MPDADTHSAVLPGENRSSSRAGRIAKATLALTAVGALVWYVDPEMLWRTLRDARLGWLAAALVLMPANLALDGWVWGVLLRPVIGRVRFAHVMGAVMAGFAVGFFTPARVGEYAGRSFYLNRGDRWTLTATVFAQRMIDMLVALAGGGAAFAAARWTGTLGPEWDAAAWVGIAMAVVLAIGAARPAVVDRAARALFPSWTALHQRVRFLRQLSVAQQTAALGGSVLRYGIYVTQLALLVYAFSPLAQPLSLVDLALGGGLTFFVKFLIPSFTLMDVGVREGATVAVFGLLGVPGAAALNASLVLFTTNLVLPSIAGIPFMKDLTWTSSPASGVDPSPEPPPNGTPAAE